MSDRKSEIDSIQASQYSFPYHYVPNVFGFPNFSKQWRFAASYLAAIRLSVKWFRSINVQQDHKHLDIGCGDGSFLANVSRQISDLGISFSGVDFDAQAIDWAKIFNSDELDFRQIDIAQLDENSYDSASLIEVLEHIPPNELPNFLCNVVKVLNDRASIIITVPSVNKKVTSKHYQHFSFASIERQLGEKFQIQNIYGFENRPFIVQFFEKILHNKYYIFESRVTNRILLRIFTKQYRTLGKCGRICIEAKVKKFK